MALAPLIHDSLGNPSTVSVTAFDGTSAGPPDPRLRIDVKNRNAILRLLQRPGELGLVRAYVGGDLDGDGDIFTLSNSHPTDASATCRSSPAPHLSGSCSPRSGPTSSSGFRPPPEEARPRGRGALEGRVTPKRSRYHYDVSNEFYELVLGPAMTYSCAVFERRGPARSAEAQANKHELICQKLRCRWGRGCSTSDAGGARCCSTPPSTTGSAAWGSRSRASSTSWRPSGSPTPGWAGQIEIRLQDYRDIDDGPFDAISSVGMFEHVGRAKMPVYNRKMFDLLRPGGRFLNHGICRPAHAQSRLGARAVQDRCHPDGDRGRVVEVLRDQEPVHRALRVPRR